MKRILIFIELILVVAGPLAAQQYRMYQSCEASIIFLNHDKFKDEKLPGTVITLSGFSNQLEIRTVLPARMDYSERSDVNHLEEGILLDLRLIVFPKKMQNYITSGKVFTTNGTLQLNNISKPVSIQYTPFPEDTETEGKMNLSLIVTFRISDFFPDQYPNESIAFVITRSFVNRL